MSESERVEQIEQAIGSLAIDRPELGLITTGYDDLRSLDEIAGCSKSLERWLEDAATLAAGIDRRTAAAYLTSILVWRWGEILAHLYLEGVATLRLAAADVHTHLWVAGHGRSRDIGFRFRLAGITTSAPLQRDEFAASAIDVHQPLVLALSRHTGLSQNALWRLVIDGMTNGFLVWGKRTGRLEFARSEAEAIFRQEPLHNPQWRFAEATGASGRSEWFRLRGGCCRLYKSEGGELCTTCVLRDRRDQMQRLSAGL